LRTVYTQAINAILLNEVTDPRTVSGDDGRILSVDIWESYFGVAKPAILNAGQVIPVNGAVRMILRLGKRRSLGTTMRQRTIGVTCSLNMYVEKSGVMDVAITLLATISTIKYLVK